MPATGDDLSALGFGCMRFPGKKGKIDPGPSARLLLRAFEQGINYFDTAMPYHRGASEPFVGKVFAEQKIRDRVHLATKLPHWLARSREDMDRLLLTQLNNLRTDHIDYYLIHNLNGSSWRRAVERGVIEFLNAARREGKIRHAGFSFHGKLDAFFEIIDAYDWEFTQIQYNFLDQEFQAGTRGLEHAAGAGLGVIVMEPLRGGFLTKRVPPEVERIWKRSDEDLTPAEWALRWIWNRPEVQVVLSGMSSEQQLQENVRTARNAAAASMTETELQTVEEAERTYRRLMKAGCTGCRYCLPCPERVEIPVCIDLLNMLYFTGNTSGLRQRYAFLLGGMASGEQGLASQCTGCGVCLEKCPQQLAIPDLIRECREELETAATGPLIMAGNLFAWFQRLRALCHGARIEKKSF